MMRAALLASMYRVVVERAEDHAFVAASAELPHLRGRGLNVESAMDALRAMLAAELPPIVAAGDAPTPIRESEGDLGVWTNDLELIESGARKSAGAPLEKPVPSALRAIAQWTADRYRAVIEVADDGLTWVGAGVEMPDVIARGATAGDVVADLRAGMADRAYRILDGGDVPPEPARDVESRRAVSVANSLRIAQVA